MKILFIKNLLFITAISLSVHKVMSDYFLTVFIFIMGLFILFSPASKEQTNKQDHSIY